MRSTQTAMASHGRFATSATVSMTAAHQGCSAMWGWGRPSLAGAGRDAGKDAGLAPSWFSGDMAHLLDAVRDARDGERVCFHETTAAVAAAGRIPVADRSKSGRACR